MYSNVSGFMTRTRSVAHPPLYSCGRLTSICHQSLLLGISGTEYDLLWNIRDVVTLETTPRSKLPSEFCTNLIWQPMPSCPAFSFKYTEIQILIQIQIYNTCTWHYFFSMPIKTVNKSTLSKRPSWQRRPLIFTIIRTIVRKYHTIGFDGNFATIFAH